MPRTALVTGSSSGFGLATCVSLSRRGWSVFASMRDPDRRGPLDAGLAGNENGRVEVVQLDVTDPASVSAAVGRVLDRTSGSLDAVVNNAGVSTGGSFEDVPEEELRWVLETNFFGTLAVTRAVLPAMRARGRGRIVVVTSSGAFFGVPGLSAYAASKWALEGWAESLAIEVDQFGIQVICVEPGSYRTGIWDSSPRHVPETGDYQAFGESVARFVDQRVVPSARDPREVGATIARALDAPRPRFRYPVGPDAVAQHLARGVVPNRLVRAGITRMLRAPRR